MIQKFFPLILLFLATCSNAAASPPNPFELTQEDINGVREIDWNIDKEYQDYISARNIFEKVRSLFDIFTALGAKPIIDEYNIKLRRKIIQRYSQLVSILEIDF